MENSSSESRVSAIEEVGNLVEVVESAMKIENVLENEVIVSSTARMEDASAKKIENNGSYVVLAEDDTKIELHEDPDYDDEDLHEWQEVGLDEAEDELIDYDYEYAIEYEEELIEGQGGANHVVMSAGLSAAGTSGVPENVPEVFEEVEQAVAGEDGHEGAEGVDADSEGEREKEEERFSSDEELYEYAYEFVQAEHVEEVYQHADNGIRNTDEMGKDVVMIDTVEGAKETFANVSEGVRSVAETINYVSEECENMPGVERLVTTTKHPKLAKDEKKYKQSENEEEVAMVDHKIDRVGEGSEEEVATGVNSGVLLGVKEKVTCDGVAIEEEKLVSSSGNADDNVLSYQLSDDISEPSMDDSSISPWKIFHPPRFGTAPPALGMPMTQLKGASTGNSLQARKDGEVEGDDATLAQEVTWGEDVVPANVKGVSSTPSQSRTGDEKAKPGTLSERVDVLEVQMEKETKALADMGKEVQAVKEEVTGSFADLNKSVADLYAKMEEMMNKISTPLHKSTDYAEKDAQTSREKDKSSAVEKARVPSRDPIVKLDSSKEESIETLAKVRIELDKDGDTQIKEQKVQKEDQKVQKDNEAETKDTEVTPDVEQPPVVSTDASMEDYIRKKVHKLQLEMTSLRQENITVTQNLSILLSKLVTPHPSHAATKRVKGKVNELVRSANIHQAELYEVRETFINEINNLHTRVKRLEDVCRELARVYNEQEFGSEIVVSNIDPPKFNMLEERKDEPLSTNNVRASDWESEVDEVDGRAQIGLQGGAGAALARVQPLKKTPSGEKIGHNKELEEDDVE